MREKRYAAKMTAAQLEAVAKVLADRVFNGPRDEVLEEALYAVNNARPSGLAARLTKAVKEADAKEEDDVWEVGGTRFLITKGLTDRSG